jgi:integrase
MAGRRGNNEGSITQRPSVRWEARISLDGNKRKSFYGKTRQEVARRLTQALNDRENRVLVTSEKQTVAQYLAGWLATIPSTVEATTVRRYAREVRLHVNPHIGNIVLSRLTGQHLQLVYAAARARGLSTTSIRLVHTMLHRPFKDAVRLGLMQRNVTELADSPRKRQHEMRVLTLEQSRAFLEAVKGNRYEAFFVFALSTGLRQGELLALRWQDVDVDDGSVQVRATLKVIGGKQVVDKTKTRRSRRKIALTPQACEALRRHRAAQIAERLALGSGWDNHDLVFPQYSWSPLRLSRTREAQLCAHSAESESSTHSLS